MTEKAEGEAFAVEAEDFSFPACMCLVAPSCCTIMMRIVPVV